MGRGTTETGLWASLHPVARGAQSLPPFKFQHSMLLSPRISWIFAPFSAALALCWSRDEQSQARSLCPCIATPSAHGMGKAPAAAAVGRAEMSLPAAESPTLMVLRAASCPAPSAKHTPQLMFLRWQINVLVSCWMAHSLSRGAVLGDRTCGPLPDHPMACACDVPGGCWGVASQEHPASGQAGMLQALAGN